MEHGRDDARNPVGEWGHVVHEDPESGEGELGLENACENGAHHGEEDDDTRCGLGVGEGSDGHVCEGRGVDEELHCEEEDQALAGGVLLGAHDGVVEAGEGEDAGEDLVGDLDGDVGDDEGAPRVGFGGAFADFVEGALGDEEGLDLLDQGCENGGDHEDGVDNTPHACLGAIGFPEGEANEQTGHGAEEQLGENVTRHTPVLLKDALRDGVDLAVEGHGKFGDIMLPALVLVLFLGTRSSMDSIKFLQNSLAIAAGLPNRVPVLSAAVGSLGDNLQHVLGRVLLITALPCAVILKVTQQRPRILANVAKVNCLSTLGQEQKTVELLEQKSVGLMDSAENSLTCVSQLAEEDTNSPGTLRVKATGGFVEEEQKFGLGNKFDADGEKLPLFHIETLAGDTDDRIGVLFHAKHLDDFFDKGVFLLGADRCRTTEYCAEPERLSNSCGIEVKI